MHYALKVKDYGSHRTGWLYPVYDGPLGPRTPRTDLPEGFVKSDRLPSESSVARSRVLCRDAVLMMAADCMWTFTYRENMEDLEKAWKDWDAFLKLFRRHYRKSLIYVVVPEYQKRGAVHFHVAVRGIFNVRIIRHLWLKVVGEGNVDMSFKPRTRSTNWTPRVMAAYMSKYLAKTFAQISGRRRFSRSHGIKRPAVFRFELCVSMSQFHDALKLFGSDVRQHREFPGGRVWFSTA